MELLIDENLAGKTIQEVALIKLKVSNGALSRLKFSGGILLNNAQARTTQRVQEGDVLRLVFHEPALPPPLPSLKPLQVVYEDEWLLVVDKPAPLPTLPSFRQEGETLENRVYTHLNCPDPFVYRPVNRLDKGTSGLMCIAKDGHTHQLLQRLLHTPKYVRVYLALCQGTFPQAVGVIDAPIARGEGIKRRVDPLGQRAVTGYEVLQSNEEISLVKLQLFTGRTHQIRVHGSSLGCPVVGDYLYGQPHPLLPGRFALHACQLALPHPVSGDMLRFESPLPETLARLLGEEQ